jgi:hypothetical protein
VWPLRLTAALVALVLLAGCGASAPRRPAPDPERTQDLVPLTPAQAGRLADRVAVVVSRGSTVVEGAPGTPFTRTTFAVEETLKGRLPRRFVLQTLGGRLGDEVVPSLVPAFKPAHRYVVFLGPDGPAGPTIFPQSVIEVTGRGTVDAIRRELR